MDKTVKAKFTRGVLEPLERLELREGEEVTISISAPPTIEDALKALRSTAGAWKGTHDPAELKKHIYADRLIATRPRPRL